MKHRSIRWALLVVALCALTLSLSAQVPTPNLSNTTIGANSSFVAGRFVANNYGNWAGQVVTGNSATGSASITVRSGYIVLSDGRAIVPFAVGVPIVVSDASPELVTPTAISGCNKTSSGGAAGGVDAPFVTCTITASFAATHGTYAQVLSATNGAAEAAMDAFNWGGGIVTLAPGWKLNLNTSCTGCYANQTAALQAILPLPSVSFEDAQLGPPVYWNLTPAFATGFTAPSALASGTVASSTTVAGSASYTGGTIHVCYTLVDIQGHEGPCSADYSFADTSAKAIAFTAPPAATGAVGWIPYIGLEGGAASNEYQVKLWTQPTVLGTAPVSSGVCTLSPILLQIGHYACALTNTTYNQTGSAATVTAYPVVTSPQAIGANGGQDGSAPTSYYNGNSASRTVYQYQPGASPGTPGVNRTYPPFTITVAAASTVPQIMGTVVLPAGFMNYVGRTIELCGQAYSSTQGASTIVQFEFEWDAQGSDVTTGLPVKIGGPMALNTLTTGTVAYFDFCQDITTTVASASATGGSLLAAHGYLAECALNTCATPAVAPNVGQAASASTGSALAGVGSLNLAGPARIQIVMVQTTSSTAVPKLYNLSLKILN